MKVRSSMEGIDVEFEAHATIQRSLEDVFGFLEI